MFHPSNDPFQQSTTTGTRTEHRAIYTFSAYDDDDDDGPADTRTTTRRHGAFCPVPRCKCSSQSEGAWLNVTGIRARHLLSSAHVGVCWRAGTCLAIELGMAAGDGWGVREQCGGRVADGGGLNWVGILELADC